MATMISVILSTYNRPDALRVVLRAYDAVEEVDFEVVVADDGSTSETADVIREVGKAVRYPLRHARHDDSGFRLAAARNLGVRAAVGEVLLFTDGDCVPFPDSLVAHKYSCRPGWASAGARLLLGAENTSDVLAVGECLPERFRRDRQSIRRRLRRARLKNRMYRLTRLKVRPKLTTANAAVHRDDFERVNGFDERFEGWGYEDEDLARRLRRIGVRTADSTVESVMLHLFHPVHTSHRPNARGSGNYRYYRRNVFLTRAVRGLKPRSFEGLKIQLHGKVPGGLADLPESPDPEVIVFFGDRAPRSLERHCQVLLLAPEAQTFNTVNGLRQFVLDKT